MPPPRPLPYSRPTKPQPEPQLLRLDEPVSRRATAIALAVGFALFVASMLLQRSEIGALAFTLGYRRWTLIALAAACAALPPVTRVLLRGWNRVADPSPKARRYAAIAVALAAAVYLTLTAHLQGRDLFPKTHDDQSYLLQMQMLARGRLWMPSHPLADFFDTFYVLAKPVYASLYFPGASLLYVPTIWLGLPTWVLPICVAGCCVGLVYRVVAEVVDGGSGLLAALGLVGLEYFRVYSALLTGHEPMLMLGLLAVWAWLRWRRATKHQWTWSLAIGVFCGWGAITRPADALCFALPIGVAMLLDLFMAPRAGEKVQAPEVRPSRARRLLLNAIPLLIGASPFLGLQLYFDHGVTGHWLQTPYTLYLDQDQPNTAFGFHPYDPAQRPRSPIQQKHDYYETFFVPYIHRHQTDQVLGWWGRVYLPMAASTALPARLAITFLPVGLLAALHDRRRWVLAAVLPLFLLVYFFNTFFLEHYAILIAPAALLLLVLGVRRTATLASTRWQGALLCGLAAGLATTSLLMLPEFNPLWGERRYASGDETIRSPFMREMKGNLPTATDLEPRTVFLFRYQRGASVVEEPVYNSDVAWPDDAKVIYAHDLGPRNIEIFRYYAERQPDRVFYRYDRSNGDLKRLGTAAELAAKPPSAG